MKRSQKKIRSKKKKKTKARKKLTAKDFIRIFAIALICAVLLLGIAARCVHFYKEHFK
jgi:hypothetical protein